MGSWGATCAPQVWLLLSPSNPGGVTGREVQGPIRLWRTPLDTGGAEESKGILEVQNKDVFCWILEVLRSLHEYWRNRDQKQCGWILEYLEYLENQYLTTLLYNVIISA